MGTTKAEAPERIWLQWHGDADPEFETGEVSVADVTWEQEQIFKHDIEYVRADLAPAGEKCVKCGHSRVNANGVCVMIREGVDTDYYKGNPCCMCKCEFTPAGESAAEWGRGLERLLDIQEGRMPAPAGERAEAVELLEQALQLSTQIGCDCDRSEVDCCSGNCPEAQVVNLMYRARKLIHPRNDILISQAAGELVSREAAARLCEDLVTHDPEHGKWETFQQGDVCGWCGGLEKAAALIRALPPVARVPVAARAAAEEIAEIFGLSRQIDSLQNIIERFCGSVTPTVEDSDDPTEAPFHHRD